ncbi:glycosyltransferase [Prochlorococcus sp. MIT 1303]|uniref:glycosyltransferase n=1 Tax=Prochlorococcus sp. MIT 1303 TaxID=1723647 RepID=UPI0007B3E52D|nr:glycosyltransferase [Prochlorococcus sp. MIT 1303]KZR61794.1 Glycosyl transferase family 2 [Prochlorococcus sp. MIT 1303]
MRLSILVVSRTATLLSRLLSSLDEATNLAAADVEILCSWNGSKNAEEEIENLSRYPLRIANRDVYHFATNNNCLAEQAKGDLLLIINDDVVLDTGSIDAAINCLISTPKAGLVGARLRSSDGMITHDGVGFTNDHSAYNLFENLIPADSHELRSYPILSPAVIGAVMLVRRSDFLAIRFDEECIVHGEDTQFCFELRRQRGLDVMVCPQCSGMHNPSSTRNTLPRQDSCQADIDLLRQRRREFLEQATAIELRKELSCTTREAHVLRGSIQGPNDDLIRWRDQVHTLQLHRLRLEQEVLRLHQQLFKLTKQ